MAAGVIVWVWPGRVAIGVASESAFVASACPDSESWRTSTAVTILIRDALLPALKSFQATFHHGGATQDGWDSLEIGYVSRDFSRERSDLLI